jgi:hypothetical protein
VVEFPTDVLAGQGRSAIWFREDWICTTSFAVVTLSFIFLRDPKM